MDALVVTGFMLALVGYALPTLLRTRRCRTVWREKLSADPPEFDPKSTSAGSLTAITSVTGGLLGSKLLPDGKDITTVALTHNFAFLGVFFAALVIIAIALYYSAMTRSVRTYIAVDTLLLWGAVGAVSTFTLLLLSLELNDSSKVTRAIYLLFVLMVLIFMFIRRSNSTVQTIHDLARAPDKSGNGWH